MEMLNKPREYYIQTLWRQLDNSEKRDLLNKLGRSEKTLYRWFKNPEYIPYIHLCEIKDFYNRKIAPKSQFSIRILVTPTKDIFTENN